MEFCQKTVNLVENKKEFHYLKETSIALPKIQEFLRPAPSAPIENPIAAAPVILMHDSPSVPPLSNEKNQILFDAINSELRKSIDNEHFEENAENTSQKINEENSRASVENKFDISEHDLVETLETKLEELTHENAKLNKDPDLESLEKIILEQENEQLRAENSQLKAELEKKKQDDYAVRIRLFNLKVPKEAKKKEKKLKRQTSCPQLFL